jgi:hypothetical protein
MLHSIYTYTRFFTTILFTGIIFSIQGQILDDTTKQLYGYHSVRYGNEEDVFLNKGLRREVDSSLASIQRYGYIYNKNKEYSQDLGNWATPLKCITSSVPTQLGAQTGFDVYSPYEYNANNIKYFDTRAPYAELKYYQGSRGQQSMEASFTRNINSQWNVGLDLRRIVSKAIIGYVSRNQKQAENYAFDFFVSHHSKNKKYFMLASFNYMEAHNFENGGIYADSTATKKDLFNNQLAQVWLTNARSLDKRYNYRLYQHYDLLDDDRLQVFYRLDYSRRTNRYDDNAFDINRPFYTNYSAYNAKGIYDTTTINDRTDFNLFDNRAGVKGNSGRFFYAAFVKNRYVTMKQASYSDSIPVYNRYTTEWYADGQLRRYFDEEQKSYLEVNAEIGFSNKTNTNANTTPNDMFALRYINKGFTIEGSTWSVSPTMLQSQYRSDLVSWNNSFNLQKTNRLFAQYTFTKKKIDIIPSITVNNYHDYIYFTQAGTPAQYDSSIVHIQPRLALRFNLWKIHIYNEFQYNNVSKGDKILQMPGIVNATQLFVEAWLFKRATLLQVGFDVLYRSSYQANGYNPLIQQYYVTQAGKDHASDFNYINHYYVVDFFVNMQIRTARLFIKMSNITGVIPNHGYFSSPYYSGIPMTIDFGISWRFFD